MCGNTKLYEKKILLKSARQKDILKMWKYLIICGNINIIEYVPCLKVAKWKSEKCNACNGEQQYAIMSAVGY